MACNRAGHAPWKEAGFKDLRGCLQRCSMKKIAILQSNYIPWKGYFDIIGSVDEFIVYDEVQFTKNDWRNRNRIKAKAGIQWLSIPVRQERLGQKISEIFVADDRWSVKHWTSLEQNYSRARHFHAVAPWVSRIYQSMARSTMLSDINMRFIREIVSYLEFRTEISSCTSYVLEGDRVERLVNLCKQAQADVYVSGPAARSYLDEQAFNAAGIAVEWMDYAGYPEYEQLFPPFEHGVSILDLLFNCGPDSKRFLKSN